VLRGGRAKPQAAKDYRPFRPFALAIKVPLYRSQKLAFQGLPGNSQISRIAVYALIVSLAALSGIFVDVGYLATCTARFAQFDLRPCP